MQKIVSVPNPVLRQVSQPVTTLDNETIHFIDDLGDTLVNKTDPAGVGLSAIQVGKPIRIFLTYLPEDKSLPANKWTPENQQLEVFINPVITKTSAKVTLGGKPDRPSLEGCLSIPKLYGPVWRYEWIELDYLSYDINHPPVTINHLEKRKNRFSGFPARVIQHEYDHLEGILFTDYVKNESPATSFKPLGEIKDLYLEDGDNLVVITNPKALLKW